MINGDKLKELNEYFEEDLSAINEELEKSKKYSTIIDDEIEKLQSITGTTRGSQHYLIEHINNAVQLQSQRQSLRKDKFNIKKTILDYSQKMSDGDNNVSELLTKIDSLISSDRKKDKEIILENKNTDQDLDKLIDEQLNSNIE